MENSPRNVVSGIRYIRFALNSFEKFSEKRYIRDSLYRVCVKSGMGCVIVERDSFAHFTALKNSPRNVVSGIRYIGFALNPVWVVLWKGTP